jgi:hypothetical protein
MEKKRKNMSHNIIAEYINASYLDYKEEGI